MKVIKQTRLDIELVQALEKIANSMEPKPSISSLIALSVAKFVQKEKKVVEPRKQSQGPKRRY